MFSGQDFSVSGNRKKYAQSKIVWWRIEKDFATCLTEILTLFERSLLNEPFDIIFCQVFNWRALLNVISSDQ